MVESEVLARPMAPSGPDPEDRRAPALEDLFRENYASLVRLASLLVDDRGLAEEVVQEAFVGLVRNWHRLADASAAPAYLRRAVLNGSRSNLRRRAVRRRHRDTEPPDAPSAEFGALARDEERTVVAAVARLPRRQ